MSCPKYFAYWSLVLGHWSFDWRTRLTPADGLRDVGDEPLRVFHELLHEPRETENQDGDHGDDLGNEGYGLILNLRQGLGQTDEQAHEHASQQHRSAEQQGGEHCLLREV